MAVTKGKFTEIIMRRISGGNPSVASPVWKQEVWEAIAQVVNGLLKVDYFGVNLQGGETLPTGYVLAIYEGIQVKAWKDRSEAQLPAMPIMLPRGVGVFHIGPEDDPSCYHAPLAAGQQYFTDTREVLSAFTGMAAYSLKGSKVVFDRVVEGPLAVHMVVVDINQFDEYALLPIPADMEKTIADTVVEMFRKQPSPDKVVDTTSEPTKPRK